MVLASMLGWLEGPKCLNHRAGTWAGCWPGAQLGVVTRGLAAPSHSRVGFLTARWLSSKKEPFKHMNAETTVLFSPALEIAPHHFCPIGLLQTGNRASSDPKGGETESLSLDGRITKYLQPSLIPQRESYLSSRQCHRNE